MDPCSDADGGIRIGVGSVDELKKIYKGGSTQPIAFPAPPPAPRPSSSAPSTLGKPNIKTLSSYLDLEKVATLSEADLTAVWRLRHASNPNSLCAVIPTSIYHKIEATAKKHPQFILPVGREANPDQLPDGAPAPAKGQTAAEIHFLQWTFPAPDTVTVLFTHLAEYKLRGEYAQPHTTVTHHLELGNTKGLVLLQGEVQEGRGMSVEDGRWLLMCLQKFYGMGEREERIRLLRRFSKGDPAFKVEELIDEAEKIL